MKPRSYMFYGTPSSGKTSLAISSFWDWKKREMREGRVGRWIRIGRETNNSLHVPEECIKSFPLPHVAPLSFMTKLEAYLRKLRAVSGGPTDIVFDGLSEWNRNFTHAFREQESDRLLEVYGSWDQKYTAVMQLLNPEELNANVFATARLAEVKETRETGGGKKIKGDPEWLQQSDIDYYAAMEGRARLDLFHNFEFAVYMEQRRKATSKGGKREYTTERVSRWLPGGPFWVKNAEEWAWTQAKQPQELVDVMWEDVEGVLEGLHGHAEGDSGDQGEGGCSGEGS